MNIFQNSFGIWHTPPLDILGLATGPGVVVILLLAILLDWIIGDPRWLPHPVEVMGTSIRLLDSNFNCMEYSPKHRKFLGFLSVLIVIGLWTIIGWFINYVIGSFPYGWLAELVMVALLIAQRSMINHCIQVIHSLKYGGISEGRKAVALIVGRNTDALDKHGVARATIESCAESYSDGVVAPIFWYLTLGLPGLLIYKAVNTMDSMIGHKNIHYQDFGMCAARLDDILNWIPARIAGFLMATAGFFVPGAHPIKGFRTMLRDSKKHISPNAGWPESACAGALDLSLLGPRIYQGHHTKLVWLGDGRKNAEVRDIKRMLVLFIIACLLATLLIVLIYISIH